MAVADHLDNHPDLSEVVLALGCIKLDKVPGSDNIPPEILKCDISCVTSEIHSVMGLCCKEGMIPQDIKDAQLIPCLKRRDQDKIVTIIE